MSEELLIAEHAEGVKVMTLNRPERLNALTWDLIEEIHDALDAIAREKSTRVLIVTGSGRGFCSGLDIAAPGAITGEDNVLDVLHNQERIAGVAVKLRELPQPVIAAVNGPAAGGGMAIALAGDVRYCSPEARFNVAFVRIGLSACDIGVSYLLPRIVGLGLASEWMLTGRQIPAEEAVRTGLANHIVEGDLLEACAELAEQISTNSPTGVKMTKQVLGLTVDSPSLRAAVELENRTQVLTTRTEDLQEALLAYQEKRAPRFQHR